MATKLKNVWYCSDCGHKQTRWVGQCPQCGQWNTLHEEVECTDKAKRFEAQSAKSSKPLRIKEVSFDEIPRILTHVREFDRLTGGGIVPGSLTLIGGDPGIGKSTLMLQLSNVMAKQGLVVLYVCGEESVEQTTMRARRLDIDSDNLLLLSETNFSHINKHIEQLKPDVLVVDSIQIVYKSEITSAPGSVSQVRETTTEFMHIAKGQGIATSLIGHVTKSGELAGPRVLEHLVDTVLYFEGEKQHNFRMIRVVKNRFGPTDEIGVFQMQKKGLAEVTNPSQIFLEERMKRAVGSVIIPTLEGSRTLLIEAQALVTETAFATPSRRCTGIDQNRLALLLAVLEKRMRYQLFRCDVFVSIAGGLRVMEPGIDLGIVMAVASSLRNKVIDPETIVVGEVGLGGEVRGISRVESRIKEAVQMGFKRCIIPKRNVKGIPAEQQGSIQVSGIEYVEEAIELLIS
jgi:DNA repair protein RadA/Sms